MNFTNYFDERSTHNRLQSVYNQTHQLAWLFSDVSVRDPSLDFAASYDQYVAREREVPSEQGGKRRDTLGKTSLRSETFSRKLVEMANSLPTTQEYKSHTAAYAQTSAS